MCGKHIFKLAQCIVLRRCVKIRQEATQSAIPVTLLNSIYSSSCLFLMLSVGFCKACWLILLIIKFPNVATVINLNPCVKECCVGSLNLRELGLKNRGIRWNSVLNLWLCVIPSKLNKYRHVFHWLHVYMFSSLCKGM